MNLRFTGFAVYLVALLAGGQAGAWTPENYVSGQVTSVSSPSLAKGPDGTIHFVAAIQLPGASDQYFYYSYWTGSGWAPLHRLPGPNAKQQQCQIAVDSQGRLHVVGIYRIGSGGVSSPYTVHYWQHSGGQWTGPTMLSSGQGDDRNSCTVPRIAIDRFDNIHVVWSQGGMVGGGGDIMYRKQDSSQWLPVHNITSNSPGTSYGSVRPDLAVDRDGNTVHVVWEDDFLNNGFQSYYTRNTNLGASNAWLPSNQWFQISTGVYQKAPHIWLDSNNNPHLKWVDRLGGSQNRHVYRYFNGSTWSHVRNWGGRDVQEMFLDDNNLAHIIYLGTDSTPIELYYVTYNPLTDTMSSPQLISAGGNTLRVDSATMIPHVGGTIMAVWNERKGEWPGQGTLLFSTNYSPDAPADVSSFVVEESDSTNRLYWKNPDSYNYSGTKVVYRTDRFPNSYTDGTLLLDRVSTRGSNDSFVHSGLTNDVTYYYVIYTYSAAGHHSTGISVSATPHQITCGEVKLRPNDSIVDLSSRVVSASFPGSGVIYIQDPKRSSGLRVITAVSSSFTPGDVVNVSGVMDTRMLSGRPSERQIKNSIITKLSSGPAPKPLFIRGINVGGSEIEPHISGVIDGVGLNNMGLLVTIAGRVTNAIGTVFYVDDLSGVVDPTGNNGILVISPVSPLPVQVGDMVSVTGIVEGSIPTGSPTNRRAIRARTVSDIIKN